MKKSSVILIRHGESLGNLSQRYFECHDTANILTQKGVDQCLELQAKISTIMNRDEMGTHTTVLASMHRRARLTAEIVTQGLHLPIHVDNRLNECWHESETKVHGTFKNVESVEFVKRRIQKILDQYEFDLILFCHGVLMEMLDPSYGYVLNTEVRKYDREDFEQRILNFGNNADFCISKDVLQVLPNIV